MSESNFEYRVNNQDPYHEQERQYRKAFDELEKSGFDINHFGGMVGGIDRIRYLTEEEKKIVYSVIQWLGTPVGRSFLKTVQGSK